MSTSPILINVLIGVVAYLVGRHRRPGWVHPFRVLISPVGEMAIGETVQMSARMIDARGHAVPTRRVTWSTDDPAIGIIDERGRFTALAPGKPAVHAFCELAPPLAR